MKKLCKTLLTVLTAVLIGVSAAGCGYEPDYSYVAIDPGELPAPEVSMDDPTFRDKYPVLEPYDEPVDIVVAAIDYDLESGVKKGTTPQNQSFNEIAKKYLNINLIYHDVATTVPTSYDTNLNLAIGSGDMPDMFYTTSASLFASLRDSGRLKDLAPYFYNLNDELLENYLTYMPDILPTAMKEGGLYALPMITNTYAAAQRLYIRQDWLDIVDMDAPTTIEEMIAVGQAFVDKKAEIAEKTGIAANRVIPFTMQKEITWAGSYSAEGLFNAHGASIGAYFDDGNGDLISSATSPETKNALSTMRDMYSRGILDVDFTSKTSEQIQANIRSGYVGMVFGEWWLPKDALDDHYTSSPKAGATYTPDWTWVDLPKYGDSESLPVVSRVSVSGYNLVSSTCAHPEAAIKLINLFYDIYYNDDAEYVNDSGVDLTLPSNGFYYQYVPIKLWDGIASVREYKRVQSVFEDLYNAGLGKDGSLAEGATEEVASTQQGDYVVSQSDGKTYILKRSLIEEIDGNDKYSEIFHTLKNREKILHFADGYPFYAAMRRKEDGLKTDGYTEAERKGWGIYYEMIDAGGSYAYVVDLTEGRKSAKYNEFYGASLSTMNDFGSYLTTRMNEVFTRIITGQDSIDYFDTFVTDVYNKGGGDKILSQVNAWYDAQPKKE